MKGASAKYSTLTLITPCYLRVSASSAFMNRENSLCQDTGRADFPFSVERIPTAEKDKNKASITKTFRPRRSQSRRRGRKTRTSCSLWAFPSHFGRNCMPWLRSPRATGDLSRRRPRLECDEFRLRGLSSELSE